MRIRKPDHIELEYAQQMMAWLLFLETPERIVQLGLGAAALTKFCYCFLKRAKVEAVELESGRRDRGARDVRTALRRRAPHHHRARSVGIRQRSRQSRHRRHVADRHLRRTARGPVLDSVSFYRACRACLTPQAGIVTINPVRRLSELRAQRAVFERGVRSPRNSACPRAKWVKGLRERGRAAERLVRHLNAARRTKTRQGGSPITLKFHICGMLGIPLA